MKTWKLVEPDTLLCCIIYVNLVLLPLRGDTSLVLVLHPWPLPLRQGEDLCPMCCSFPNLRENPHLSQDECPTEGKISFLLCLAYLTAGKHKCLLSHSSPRVYPAIKGNIDRKYGRRLWRQDDKIHGDERI